MNVLQRSWFRVRVSLARGLVKSMGITWVPDWMKYSFLEPTFKALVREGYAANGAVFACVSALAFAFIEPVLRIYQEEEEGRTQLRTHPLMKLLKHPNAQMGMLELLLFTIIYLAIGGNAYWYKVRSKAGRVAELWVYSDAQLKPVAGKTTLVSHYELTTDSGKPETIAAEDVVHFKWLINPLQPWRGQAPLAAVAREVDTDNEVTRYLFTLLKNDAIPRIALVAPESQVIDDDMYERMQKRWIERFGGDNRGLPGILEGGLDIKKLGLDLKELAFEGLHGVPETRIAAAFRVPMIVAGLGRGLENATYSNQAGLEKSFTQRTLVPLWRMVEAEITADLLSEFDTDDSHLVAFDTGNVVALQEDLKEKRAWALDALARGGIMLNEFRAFVGLKREPQGDVYYVPLGVFVTDGASLRDDPNAPPDAAGAPKQLRGGTEYEQKAKRRRASEKVIAAQRKQRERVAKRMQRALDKYFGELADRVVGRLEKSFFGMQVKALPKAEDLLTAKDADELEEVVKRFYVELLEISWDTWNAALGVELDFDLIDATVTKILGSAGKRIRQITETTRDAVRDVLKYGNENGWSVDDLVRGDPANGIRGLREIVQETYKNRAESIARTELGTAQNAAAADRYDRAGVTEVFVMDNGLDDDDSACKELNGTVQTLAWAQEHPLEHPRCTRAIAPHFGD